MKEEISVILLLWFALQVPLGIVVGKCIRFGMSDARNDKRQASSASSLGITKWWHSGSVMGWRAHSVPPQFATAKYRHRQ